MFGLLQIGPRYCATAVTVSTIVVVVVLVTLSLAVMEIVVVVVEVADTVEVAVAELFATTLQVGRTPLRVPAPAHQPGVLEHLDVLRGGGERDREGFSVTSTDEVAVTLVVVNGVVVAETVTGVSRHVHTLPTKDLACFWTLAQ